MKKYVIICYAVHDRRTASCVPADSYDQAKALLIEDAKNTYQEEYDNSLDDERESINLSIYEDTAVLTSCENEFIWTWEIIEIDAN